MDARNPIEDAREMAIPFPRELIEPLLAAPVSSSTPWLLELMRAQAARKRPRDLLAQFGRDAFVAPGVLDLRMAHRLDGLALRAADGYDALQLSPVAPLGVCSALAPTSQDRTLSALRGTEVVSDPTNVLALECARRLLAQPEQPVRLCTVHQVLRAQPLPARAGHTRHFRMFALVDAGPGLAEDGFEVDAVVRHLRVFDRLLDLATEELRCAYPNRRVLVRTDEARATLGARLGERLSRELPHVALERESFSSAYYAGVRVGFGPRTAAGEWSAIGDIGVFDWLEKLTANRRMRLLAGGFGLQLLPLLFGPQ
jgi:hypothetical protein